MNALFTILVVLIVIAAILLILVVLLQNGKGDGMASNFVAGNQTFGVRQTADILEKVTWGLVIVVAVFSILASYPSRTRNTTNDINDRIENAASQPEFPSAPVQANPEEE